MRENLKDWEIAKIMFGKNTKPYIEIVKKLRKHGRIKEVCDDWGIIKDHRLRNDIGWIISSDCYDPSEIKPYYVDFMYAGGAMGWGKGHLWHKLLGLKFPDFPIITKTMTLSEKIGYPYAVVITGKSVFNHYGHHNKGFEYFMNNHYNKDLIVSIAGTDFEVEYMVNYLNQFDIKGIQLSYSCPNVEDQKNKIIPKSKHDIYLKLNHLQDPYRFDLSRVKAITVNSVPCWFGGGSGKYAQKYNWPWIKKFNEEGLNVHGASWITMDDIKYLEEYCGCTTLDIGSVMLVNPKLVLNLK